MEAGDALVFRTDSIPHIGYPPVNRDGLRVSGESRYALLKRPLVISDAYSITSTDPPSLEKVESGPYINEEIDDTIFQYFSEQFTIFLEVYNELGLAGKLSLNIELFERFMDETPYDDYYYGQALEEKNATIKNFFKVTLAEV